MNEIVYKEETLFPVIEYFKEEGAFEEFFVGEGELQYKIPLEEWKEKTGMKIKKICRRRVLDRNNGLDSLNYFIMMPDGGAIELECEEEEYFICIYCNMEKNTYM